MSMLQKKYSTVEAFNEAWNTRGGFICRAQRHSAGRGHAAGV
ncbi:MAG: hypothetical protein WDO13_07195 [Verrucomicrobiota bacterium]